MLIDKIIDYLDRFFPLDLQLNFDNSGYQITNSGKTDKILITLDVDLKAIEFAKKNDVNLIISHHPLIFNGIKSINLDSVQGNIIKEAIVNDIAIYSLHTCLDIGTDNHSMNHWLLEKMGYQNIEAFDDERLAKKVLFDKAIDTHSFIQKVKKTFNLTKVNYNTNYPYKLSGVVMVGGSGSEYLRKLPQDVNCLITGDCKYHQYQEANEMGVLLIDITHQSEDIMVDRLKELLEVFELPILTIKDNHYMTSL